MPKFPTPSTRTVTPTTTPPSANAYRTTGTTRARWAAAPTGSSVTSRVWSSSSSATHATPRRERLRAHRHFDPPHQSSWPRKLARASCTSASFSRVSTARGADRRGVPPFKDGPCSPAISGPTATSTSAGTPTSPVRRQASALGDVPRAQRRPAARRGLHEPRQPHHGPDAQLPPLLRQEHSSGLRPDRTAARRVGWVDTNGNGIRDKEIDGQRREFEFADTYGSWTSSRRWAIYKEDLAKVGIAMTVRPMTGPTSSRGGRPRLRRGHPGLGQFSEGRLLSNLAQQSGGRRQGQPRLPQRRGRRDHRRAQREFDHDKRVELAHRFHKLTYDEQPYTFFTRKRKVYGSPN